MKPLYALIHQEDDSAFGLSFPDLPGCFAASDNEDDIYSNAADALTLFLEDLDTIPAQRSLSDLRIDPDIAAELAQGAMLVPIHYVYPSGVTKRANLTIDQALLQAIDDLASKQNNTRSGLVADVMRQYIAVQSAVAG